MALSCNTGLGLFTDKSEAEVPARGKAGVRGQEATLVEQQHDAGGRREQAGLLSETTCKVFLVARGGFEQFGVTMPSPLAMP